MAESRCYRHRGKTYKHGCHPEVNWSHAFEDIQAYVRNLPKDAVVFPRGPEEEVPYTSIQDYVCTLRRACGPDGPFIWPSESMRFENVIAVAAHHLPPGHAMCIQNKRPIPQDISDKQPSASGAGSSGTGGGPMSEATERGGGQMSEATAAGSAGSGARAHQAPPAFSRREPVGGSDTHFFAWNESAPDKP